METGKELLEVNTDSYTITDIISCNINYSLDWHSMDSFSINTANIREYMNEEVKIVSISDEGKNIIFRGVIESVKHNIKEETVSINGRSIQKYFQDCVLVNDTVTYSPTTLRASFNEVSLTDIIKDILTQVNKQTSTSIPFSLSTSDILNFFEKINFDFRYTNAYDAISRLIDMTSFNAVISYSDTNNTLSFIPYYTTSSLLTPTVYPINPLNTVNLETFSINSENWLQIKQQGVGGNTLATFDVSPITFGKKVMMGGAFFMSYNYNWDEKESIVNPRFEEGSKGWTLPGNNIIVNSIPDGSEIPDGSYALRLVKGEKVISDPFIVKNRELEITSYSPDGQQSQVTLRKYNYGITPDEDVGFFRTFVQDTGWGTDYITLLRDKDENYYDRGFGRKMRIVFEGLGDASAYISAVKQVNEVLPNNKTDKYITSFSYKYRLKQDGEWSDWSPWYGKSLGIAFKGEMAEAIEFKCELKTSWKFMSSIVKKKMVIVTYDPQVSETFHVSNIQNVNINTDATELYDGVVVIGGKGDQKFGIIIDRIKDDYTKARKRKLIRANDVETLMDAERIGENYLWEHQSPKTSITFTTPTKNSNIGDIVFFEAGNVAQPYRILNIARNFTTNNVTDKITLGWQLPTLTNRTVRRAMDDRRLQMSF